MIEGIQMDKSEVKKHLAESLVSYLSGLEKEHGRVIIVLTVENETPVWGVYKVFLEGIKREKRFINSYPTEEFFKKVVLSQADNLAVKIQVKAIFSTIGKTVFPEVEKGIIQKLPEGQNVMIARVGEGLLITLNEGERFIKKLSFDEIL